MFDVFAKALTAFEAKLYERTFAFGFTPDGLARHDYAQETRAEISLQVLTVLVAFRAYVEGTEEHLKRLRHPKADQIRTAFKTAKLNCEKDSFEYRLSWELRNAAAHRRPVLRSPPSGMQRHWPDGLPSADAPMLQTFTTDPAISLSEIIDEMRTGARSKGKAKENERAQALKDELIALREDQGVKWLDLKYILRKLAADIVTLHLTFGDTLLPIADEADALIRAEIDKANRKGSWDYNTWSLTDDATGEATYFGNETPPRHRERFTQWRRLANLALAVVSLEIAHRKET